MEQKYSLAHLTVLDCSPPEMTYIASKAGYDYVSFRPIYMGLPGEPNYDLARNQAMFKETKKALNETGLELLDIELAKVEKRRDPKEYEPAMEVAAELGGKHILSSVWTDDQSMAQEKFIEICELAKPYGLSVELEFVPVASVRTLSQAVDLLNKTNQENSGLMIDVYHFETAGENVEDLKSIPSSWFNYLHICDKKYDQNLSHEEKTRLMREERQLLGEGIIDVNEIVQSLPAMPYSIELPNHYLAKTLGYEEFARKCLTSAKEYFEKQNTKNFT